MGARRLLRRDEWLMLPGERAALEGVLSFVSPRVSIEIGTHAGGSLALISAHSESVHAFDVRTHPAVERERFPNVEFHIGDSHELLAPFLAKLAGDDGSIDFAFVDGDHTAQGVRRDVLDLLESPCLRRSVILLHDTLNLEVRAGLEEIDFTVFESVRFVDLDFVQGRVMREGPQANELWWGLGLIATGAGVVEEVWPPSYSAREVYAGFSRSLTESGQLDDAIGYGQLVELRDEIDTLKSLVHKMEGSASWRLTRPLRAVKARLRRLRSGRGSARPTS